jgi:hypothetical protein
MGDVRALRAGRRRERRKQQAEQNGGAIRYVEASHHHVLGPVPSYRFVAQTGPHYASCVWST